MRPGPATQAASFVDLPFLPSRCQKQRDDGTSPTALAMSATFTGPAADRRFVESLLRNLCDGQRPNPLKKREVEEAAMPRQPARTRARFRISSGNSPSRIASCHQRHRNRRSTNRKVLTYLVKTLCNSRSQAATLKPSALVQNLWTITIPCGLLRKMRRKSQHQKPRRGFSIT